MRIGVDARLLYYQRAGISTYIRGLLGGLAAVAGDEQLVILRSHRDGELAVRRPGTTVSRLWTPCHHRYEQWLLPIELSLRQLDVLHSPDFIPPFRRRCPAVITVHDLAFLRYPSLLTPESARYYGQVDDAVASAEAIIAVSESTKRDLLQLLGAAEQKIHVVPEGVDPACRVLDDPRLVAEVAGRHGMEPGFFLFVGTLEPRKNLAALIKAYALVHERHQAVGAPKLALVGSRGWLCEDIYALVAQLNLADDVRFLGPVGPEDLVGLYNGAVALVFVSLYEGFGLPALEAMACGTPVIAANVSSLPEVVGDAALLVSPHEIEDIAAAMGHLICDGELRQELRARGLARAGQFSWGRAARETLAVYEEAAR